MRMQSSDRTGPAAELTDPATSAHRLSEIAVTHPELRGAIASHPNAYPGLLEWMENQERPAVASRLPGPSAQADVRQELRAPANVDGSAPSDFSLKRRWVPWVIALSISVSLLLTGSLLTLKVVQDNTPAGTLGDNTEWGPGLGAVTEAKSKLGGGYSWTTSPWISPSGAYIYAYSEEAIDILSSDDLSLIEQHELSFDYADSNATVSDFVTTRDGTSVRVS